MSSSAALHTQLATVMESLVHAAVAELKKLVEDSSAGEQPPPPAREQEESRDQMVRFASIMETLGNEALGKIVNIVDEAKLLVELQAGRGGKRPQTSILSVLNKARVEVEHSYGLRLQSADTDGSAQAKPPEEGVETPFVLAVTVKDEHGNIDLGAIAERARVEAAQPVTSDPECAKVPGSPEFVLQSAVQHGAAPLRAQRHPETGWTRLRPAAGRSAACPGVTLRLSRCPADRGGAASSRPRSCRAAPTEDPQINSSHRRGCWSEMERSDDASSLPATVNYSDESSPHHHPPSSSADVTAWGRPTCRRVACSGDGEEEEEESDSHHSLRGPIRCSPEAREADDGQGARPSPGDDVTRTDSTVCSHSMASCSEGSKVNHCYRLDTGGHSGVGATGGTDCHTPPSKASKVNINPVTRESDTDSDTQHGDLTFDLQEVSSDDETFITEPPPPQGELSLPPAASRSRNTYECGRRQSAPGQLVQDGSQAELQSRRPGIVDYFSR
eukprot:superscaffoldBa00008182_g23145